MSWEERRTGAMPLQRRGKVQGRGRAVPPPRVVSSSALAGAGPEPVAKLGPQALLGAAAGHKADVAGVEDEELLILARDEVHGGLGLREGADVILLARDVQERDLYVREVHVAAAEVDVTLHQPVVLVEVGDPLPEGRAGEGGPVVDPLVHREPGLHRLLVEDALPHADVSADVVGDRLEHPVARVDHLARDVAERVGQQPRAEVLAVGEDLVEPDLLARERHRGGEQDEVPEVLGEEGGVHGAHRPAHAVAEEGELLGARDPHDLLGRSRQVVEYVVFEVEVLVLVAGDAPVEHVDVEALAHEVLDQAVARDEVEDVGAVYERVDDEDRDRVFLWLLGLVAVELGLVLGPDSRLGGLACFGLGALDNDPQSPVVLLEEVLELRGRDACLLLRHLDPVEALLQLADLLCGGGPGVTVLELLEGLLQAIHLVLERHDEACYPRYVRADRYLEALEVLLGTARVQLVEARVALQPLAGGLEELLLLDDVLYELGERAACRVVPLYGELQRVLRKAPGAHQVGPRLLEHLEVTRGHVQHLPTELRRLLPGLHGRVEPPAPQLPRIGYLRAVGCCGAHHLLTRDLRSLEPLPVQAVGVRVALSLQHVSPHPGAGLEPPSPELRRVHANPKPPLLRQAAYLLVSRVKRPSQRPDGKSPGCSPRPSEPDYTCKTEVYV